MEALENLRPEDGEGVLDIAARSKSRVSSHSEIIGLLAVIGRAMGYDIWIGRNEQGHSMNGLAPEGTLGGLVTFRPKKLDGISTIK